MFRPALAPGVLSEGHVTAQQFRDAFAQLPTGVTILTCYTPDGRPAGMTASAVCSLSQDPPMALAAVGNAGRTLSFIRAHGAFGINVLRAQQAPLAALFARAAADPADRFAGLRHDRIASVPVLHRPLAWLACELTGAHPGGDHTILTGLVRAAEHGTGRPLIRHDRGFTATA
ncbi:flavin reductase family protein [Streptomyces sp. ODS28]|uniref:flavin reductase family protein n=1 Tax=Streptomyces sp. ODS28 TaxID=3136688 RepID=UPI0031EA0A97